MVPTEYVAIIISENSLRRLAVFEGDGGLRYVRMDGKFLPLDGMSGFVRQESDTPKKHLSRSGGIVR